jgi:SAM-dependent methyltransferase
MEPMDRSKVDAFVDTFVGFAAGATTIGVLAVADRTGLSSHLGKTGGGTAAEIAEGAGLDLRYVEEILAGLAAAGVVDYQPSTRVFHLPPEHALFIADETSPYFMGGFLDILPAALAQVDGVAGASLHGGGVPFDAFGLRFVTGLDRGNSPSQRVFLTSRWLPAVPGVVERLEEGGRAADVGCGSGTAAILMAERFPKSEVIGFEISAGSLELARERSSHLTNLSFVECAAEEIPIDPPFDLITTFDVIHDLTTPLDGMRRIRAALAAHGVYLMMEPDAGSRIEDNLNPRGAMLYGISLLHCMTQSLADGGAGLGAAWGRERAEELAGEAGFTGFQRLDEISNRFSAFYLLTK